MNIESINNIEVINKNKSRGLINVANQLFIICFCIWASWPYLNFATGLYVGIPLAFMWLITTDLRWLVRKMSPDWVFILSFFVTLIPYIATGTFQFSTLNPLSFLGTVFLFFFGIFVSHYYIYYKKDFVVAGRIAFFAIIFFTVGAIQTYIGLLEFPTAARALARGGSEKYQELFQSMGIGGYGFSFSLVFIVLASSFFLTKGSPTLRFFYKLILILSIAISSLTIFKTSYATAVIFIVVGTILLFIIKNVYASIITVVFIFVLLTFGENFLGEKLLLLGEQLENNQILQNKVFEFANSLLGTGEAYHFGKRLDLYETSFMVFIKYPLFGIYGPGGNFQELGNHAGWLDMMACYGLFSVVPMFLGIFFNMKKHISFFKGNPYHRSIIITAILFILLGFIKSNISVSQIGITMFMIVPAMPFLPYAFRGISKNS